MRQYHALLCRSRLHSDHPRADAGLQLNARTAHVDSARGRTALEAQVAALREAERLTLDSYGVGVSNYLDVLDAQQQLYPAESSLAQTQRDQLLAVVNLYKALGGGWETPGRQVAER